MPFERYEVDGYTVIEFASDEHVKEIQLYVDQTSVSDVIYIALEGTQTTHLDSTKFLVENKESSWLNHMMWRGLLSTEAQREYTVDRVKQFIASGNQMIIENYEFVEDEPFYDYSGR